LSYVLASFGTDFYPAPGRPAFAVLLLLSPFHIVCTVTERVPASIPHPFVVRHQATPHRIKVLRSFSGFSSVDRPVLFFLFRLVFLLFLLDKN